MLANSARDVVLVVLDALVGVLQCLRLEWWFANQESVEDTPNGPDIDLVAVTFFSEHLRSNVVRCSTKRPFTFAIKKFFRCQTEVSDFDLHFVVEKDIAQFQVAMDDLLK